VLSSVIENPATRGILRPHTAPPAKQLVEGGGFDIHVDDDDLFVARLEEMAARKEESRSVAAPITTVKDVSASDLAVAHAVDARTVRRSSFQHTQANNAHFTHNLLDLFVAKAAPPPKRPGRELLVLSPGDSGDALVARILMWAGADGGKRTDFVLHGSGANPRGPWARQDLVKMHQGLLDATRSSHSAADPFQTAVGFSLLNVSGGEQSFFQGRITHLLETLTPPIVLKDTPMSLVLPLYRPLLDSPICVLTYRHPVAFATALLKRRFSNWGHFEWIALWEKYTLAALAGCSHLPKVLVSYEQLLRDPVPTVQQLVQQVRNLGAVELHDVPSDQLREWLPDPSPFDAAESIARFSNELSQQQRQLIAAFESGEIVKWNLRDESTINEVASNIVLPQEASILGSGENGTAPAEDERTLPEVLPDVAISSHGRPGEAATDVIAVYSNTAFVDLVKNLVCNFNTLGIERYIIFSLDAEMCSKLRVVDAPCYFDRKWGTGIGDIQFWTSAAHSDYFKLLLMKMNYAEMVLAAGNNVLLIDADVAFFSNAHRHIVDTYPDIDLVLQSDARVAKPETHDWVCAGFFYARSSPRTIAFMQEVQRIMSDIGTTDQDTVQFLLTGHGQAMDFPDNYPHISADEMGLTWTMLDPLEYPNGDVIFDRNLPGLNDVVPLMAHSNGRPLKRKIKDMSAHDLWFLNEDMDGCAEVRASLSEEAAS
jgi:hypothetical protein